MVVSSLVGKVGSVKQWVGSVKQWVRSSVTKALRKNWLRLWCEASLQVKIVKNCRSRTAFGSWDVKKVHVAVVRSTLFLTLLHWCEAHLQVKTVKTCAPVWCEARLPVKIIDTSPGPLLEVKMSKKCTPLRREARFRFKIVPASHAHDIFFWGLEMSKKCRPLEADRDRQSR